MHVCKFCPSYLKLSVKVRNALIMGMIFVSFSHTCIWFQIDECPVCPAPKDSASIKAFTSLLDSLTLEGSNVGFKSAGCITLKMLKMVRTSPLHGTRHQNDRTASFCQSWFAGFHLLALTMLCEPYLSANWKCISPLGFKV